MSSRFPTEFCSSLASSLEIRTGFLCDFLWNYVEFCGHPYRVGDSNWKCFQGGYHVDIPTELVHLVATRVFVAVIVLRILSAN